MGMEIETEANKDVGRGGSKGERTLLWSLLLSAPGPLVTGFAVVSSRSTTQLADFLRRTTELVAIFVSWWVYRALRRGDAAQGSETDDSDDGMAPADEAAGKCRLIGMSGAPNDGMAPADEAAGGETDWTEKVRLERLANLCVGGAMLLSGVVMLCIAVFGSAWGQDKGNVIPGLTIAFLGLITNTWFWLRYQAMNRERHDSVIAAQSSLYRAKSLVDLCVVTALGAVAVAPLHPVTQYIDVIGSVIVALFLVWNGAGVIRRTLVPPPTA